MHAIVLSGDDAPLAAAYPPDAADEETLRRVLPGAIARNDERLAASLASAPQTNETARSGMLLPGLLLIARETGLPLALHEIGSSAGLNLLFDRFHYRFGDAEWGDPASAVRLQPEMRGTAIPMDGLANVVSRKGSDIAPVYVKDPADRLRLRSYIWPDQAARLERLDAAHSPCGRHALWTRKNRRRCLRPQKPGGAVAGLGLRAVSHDHVAIYAEGDKGRDPRRAAGSRRTGDGRRADCAAEDGAARPGEQLGGAQPDALAWRRDKASRQLRLSRPLDRMDRLSLTIPIESE